MMPDFYKRRHKSTTPTQGTRPQDVVGQSELIPPPGGLCQRYNHTRRSDNNWSVFTGLAM